MIITTVKELREYLDLQRRSGKTIGFVPTMGFLHEGHLSLIRRAKAENDIVVVSDFVNPTQFGPNEDFESYPRDIRRDEELATGAGADLIFYPSVEEIYPRGSSTFVEVTGEYHPHTLRCIPADPFQGGHNGSDHPLQHHRASPKRPILNKRMRSRQPY